MVPQLQICVRGVVSIYVPGPRTSPPRASWTRLSSHVVRVHLYTAGVLACIGSLESIVISLVPRWLLSMLQRGGVTSKAATSATLTMTVVRTASLVVFSHAAQLSHRTMSELHC